MTIKEKLEIKSRLIQAMSDFITKETEDDNGIGYIPNNIESIMADAAFSVLETVVETNKFFEEQGMLK